MSLRRKIQKNMIIVIAATLLVTYAMTIFVIYRQNVRLMEEEAQQAGRLVRPINELDIEHPLDNEVYEELTPLLQSIDEQNKAKDAVANMRREFSANVSHELKTPLTSISGYAEIMKNGLVKPEDTEDFAGWIRAIRGKPAGRGWSFRFGENQKNHTSLILCMNT